MKNTIRGMGQYLIPGSKIDPISWPLRNWRILRDVFLDIVISRISKDYDKRNGHEMLRFLVCGYFVVLVLIVIMFKAIKK